ncbi:uncharacterized protein PAC_06226 [Phialocephala subalpina]|uniref:Glucose-methanol-choline oxidoreductase N-terminal domain-containing protein n=1 Tax=Phialocephala subalpina TaxID=576137 RepID=A0A1L7WU96_9HELO|nr:uncharacterized protein PAC_06226 [Phialocephala subalpina]
MYAADPRYNASNPGKKMQAFARNKVIVASGTFNTPQLLKLSGIRPKAELTKFNISVLVDPRLQDNTKFGSIAQAATDFGDISQVCTYGASGDPCLAAWHQGKGPYTDGPLDSLMYKTSNAAMNERGIFFGIPGANPFRGYYPSDTVNTIYNDPPSTFDWSMIKSIPLAVSAPESHADADKDISAIAEAVKFRRKIFNNLPKEMQPWKEVLPCDGTTTCDMKTVIKEQAWSHHATSSAQIGADNDPMAVLDGKFKVRGVSGFEGCGCECVSEDTGWFSCYSDVHVGDEG